MKPHKNFRRKTYPTARLKAALFFVCAGLLTMNAGAAWFQNKYSREMTAHILKEAKGHGLELSPPEFRCSGFAGFNRLRWKNIRGQVSMESAGALKDRRSFVFRVRSLDAVWVGLFPPIFEVRAEGIRILSKELAETLKDELSGERLDEGTLRFKTRCTFWNARKARREAAALFHQGLALFRKGKTPLALDFKARLYFEIRGTSVQAGIESQRVSGQTSLKMPVQDLITISAVLDESLTSQEIQILSENPLAAPELLKIRNYARSTAYQTGKKNPAVPKDAYRHILWSYLLTRAFGESFSKEITEAHEINSVLENTAAQKEMDFNNNAVGRRYARLGYEESSILTRLMKDPAVIRYSTPQKGR